MERRDEGRGSHSPFAQDGVVNSVVQCSFFSCEFSLRNRLKKIHEGGKKESKFLYVQTDQDENASKILGKQLKILIS